MKSTNIKTHFKFNAKNTDIKYENYITKLLPISNKPHYSQEESVNDKNKIVLTLNKANNMNHPEIRSEGNELKI